MFIFHIDRGTIPDAVQLMLIVMLIYVLIMRWHASVAPRRGGCARTMISADKQRARRKPDDGLLSRILKKKKTRDLVLVNIYKILENLYPAAVIFRTDIERLSRSFEFVITYLRYIHSLIFYVH